MIKNFQTMKYLFVTLAFLFFTSNVNAQLKEKLNGKFTCKVVVTTEFTDFAEATKQVAENTQKYNWLDAGVFNFKKDDLFEVKLKSGKTEKGRFTASDTRVILLFDNEEIEEFNTTTPKVDDKKVILPFGRQLTKVNLELSK